MALALRGARQAGDRRDRCARRRRSCSRSPTSDGLADCRRGHRDSRRRADHGVQRARSHRRRRARSLAGDQHRSSSRQHAATARSTGSTNRAAACGELVFTLIDALGVPLTPDIATHIYLAILTDTGSFHFSHLTPRTFEIAGRAVGSRRRPAVDRAHALRQQHAGARANLRRGAERDDDARGRARGAAHDHAGAGRDLGGTYDDTEGLINFPLTVKDIQAVAFFKEMGPGDWRVSLRSKGAVDTGRIAKQFGGGGHMNASGCGWQGSIRRRPCRSSRASLAQAVSG